MTRCGTLLVARLGSTRLPGKLLLPVMERPILEYLVERLQRAQIPEDIVLCTTRLPEDQPLIDLAERLGLHHHRGDTDDVLLRITEAASRFQMDVLVTVGGDDILADPFHLDAIAETLLTQPDADFASCPNLPVGASPYGVRRGSMEELMSIREGGTDGWERYFANSDRFRAVEVEVRDPRLHRPELRLTLDYQEDFDALRMILEELYPVHPDFSLQDVLDLLDRRPDLLALSQQRADEWKKHWRSLDVSIVDEE